MKWLQLAFVVLRQGACLADAATWKNRQQAANAVLAVLAAAMPLVGHYLPGVSHEDLVAVAGGLAAVGGLLNAYFIPATSAKVGLPPAGGDAGSGSSGAGDARAASEAARRESPFNETGDYVR